MDDARKKAELRARMKDAAQKREKRIDSPLVRYNNLGQPVCQICDATVKSEVLWPTHLASRGHREMVESLKRRVGGGGGETAPSVTPASKPSTGSSVGMHKQAATLPPGFFDSAKPASGGPSAPAGGKSAAASISASTNNSVIGAGSSSSSDVAGARNSSGAGARMPPPAAVPTAHVPAPAESAAQRDGAALSPASKVPTRPVAAVPPVVGEEARRGKGQGLPVGFFDADGPASGDVATTAAKLGGGAAAGGATKPTAGSSAWEAADGGGAPLPKGFFDDVAADHKARGVELIKPDIHKEWGEFQKVVIEKEKEADEARAMEEQEEAADELDEREAVLQRDVQSRIAQLRRQKELQLQQLKKRKATAEDGDVLQHGLQTNKRKLGTEAGENANGNGGVNDMVDDEGEEIPEDVLFDWRIKKL